MNSTTACSKNHAFVRLCSLSVAFGLSVNGLFAGDIFRADTPNNLNEDAAWTTVAPTGGDVAVWNSTLATAINGTNALGADLSWQGIRIADPAVGIMVNAGNTLTLGTSGIDMSAALQNLTLANALSLGTAQTWNVGSGRTLTVSGAVTQTGAGNGITKTGTGTLAISGTSSFADGITVNQGEVLVTGGTMPIKLNGGLFTVGAALSTPIDVSVNGGTITPNNNRTLSGAFTGSGTANISIGVATRTLSFGSDVFSGFNGTIALGTSIGGIRPNNAAFAGSDNVTFDLGSSTGYLTRNNSASTVNLGALSGGSGTQIRNGGTTYAIGGKNINSTFSGDIQGTANVVKKGTATLVLNGTNTYTGTTTVSNGTLQVDGALAATSSLTVDVAGRLTGNGSINGVTTINGEIAPGTSIGTLTFNNSLVLAGLTTLELNRTNTQTADLLNVLGTLTLGGTLTLVNTGDALQSGDNFNLFDGTITGSFGTTNLPSLDSGLTWDFAQFDTLGVVAVAAIPEPSAVALGIAASLAVLWRSRFRQSRSKGNAA